ncbi:hypothetical protein J2W35_004928 [Variovorax boronicumulans]|uniref:hypothetical protein n=1 Tax=Variovorax boronicumulans TaxID=436515 RepID=UPI0027879BC9|nr:hypothetical protein [Variovorax boronicumulans]MDQ0084559.1 hypothetical protein [Variovorax boronicumulans]
MNQYEFSARPAMHAVDTALIAKQPSMTKALQLCQTLSGLDDKAFYGVGGIVKDQAQWSRIMNAGAHNFPQDGLNTFMDKAENEAPLLWLLYSRGYDLDSLRHRETEMEKRVRLAEERALKAEEKARILTEAMHGRTTTV